MIPIVGLVAGSVLLSMSLWDLLWPVQILVLLPWHLLKRLLQERFSDVWWAATVPLANIPTKKQRQETLKAVLEAPDVHAAVVEEASRTNQHVRKVQKKAKQHLTRMAACHNPFMLRVFAYLFKKVVPMLYLFGIHFDPDQVARVRKAGQQGISLVYIPTHKSHMDYLILTYICILNQLPVPHVVAGDNLNFALIGRGLKLGGALYIRRQFGKDPLYHAIFRTYIRVLVAKGHALECFIESQRSRTGKLLLPKTGFLRCVTDTVLDQHCEDAYIVPVALGYDRVMENENYAVEIMGGKKVPERLQSLIAVVCRYVPSEEATHVFAMSTPPLRTMCGQ